MVRKYRSKDGYYHIYEDDYLQEFTFMDLNYIKRGLSIYYLKKMYFTKPFYAQHVKIKINSLKLTLYEDYLVA